MDFAAAADTLACIALIPLAVWITVSGLDDLVVDAFWLLGRRKRRAALAHPAAEKRIALFVPLWQESGVIRRMVEHNCKAIAYANYHFFLGGYPNDSYTLAVLEELEAEHENVHVALCPHDGPTSKADCLNWIYQRMLLWEEQSGLAFEAVVIHDAEDLIHPRAFAAMNAALETHDTVQVPVLALRTPLGELTHGVYCDEFAEYQTRDMEARSRMGAFVPSCGVGTAYRREILERLAVEQGNRLFDPSCLTEDYDNGLRLHHAGARQTFLPVVAASGRLIATREFFPRRFGAAVRQRARWITGHVMQSWEQHGWRTTWRNRYWFWRDRKGLPGSLIGAATNLITLWFAVSRMCGMCRPLPGLIEMLAPFTLALLAWRLGLRCVVTARVYGWKFAAGVPLRAFWGNAVNAAAALRAVRIYALARWRREPLRWHKTAHDYPSIETLRQQPCVLGDEFVPAG